MVQIENDHQYNVTKNLVLEVSEQIEKIKSKSGVNPLRKELIRTSLEVFREELQQQLAEYESGDSPTP